MFRGCMWDVVVGVEYCLYLCVYMYGLVWCNILFELKGREGKRREEGHLSLSLCLLLSRVSSAPPSRGGRGNVDRLHSSSYMRCSGMTVGT